MVRSYIDQSTLSFIKKNDKEQKHYFEGKKKRKEDQFLPLIAS
jgi:hypothetical protein